MKQTLVPLIFSVGSMVSGADPALGQDYPTKPIRMVVAGIGGGSDFTARLIAQGISGPLGQPVIVDNRSGLIANEIVARAQPDGYTLLVVGSNLWIGALIRKTPYDPIKDFAPITLATHSPAVLVVHPSLPVKSVKELIALAKASPGKLNYSSAGIGGSGHLSGQLFNGVAGVNIVHVPFQGGGAALNGVVTGQVQMLFDGGSALMQQVKSGRLNALAVTSAKQSALFPDLPAVAASLPGFESESMTGVFAPSKTPKTIISRLHHEIVRLLNQPDVKQKFFNSGVETGGNSPEQFAAVIRSEMIRWGKVIKDAGIKTD